MKNLARSSLVFLFLCFLAFNSCVVSPTNQKVFEMLIVTQQVNEPNSKLSSDLITLMLPTHSANCSDTLLTPSVTLSRIDLNKVVEQKIELTKNMFENFYATKDDAAKIKEKLGSQISLNRDFSAPNGKIAAENLGAVLKGINLDVIFVFNSEGRTMQVNGKELAIFSDLTELQKAVSQYVCAQNGRACKLVVLYNLDYGAAVEQMEIIPGTSNDSLPDEMKAVLEEVAELNQSANSWKTLYDSIGLHIHTASEHKFGHPEGYTLLVTAAKRAIDDGQHMAMYEKMRVDVDKKAEVAKLAAGHHHWEEVVQSLLKKDKTLLNHVLSEVYLNWSNILHGKGDLDEHHGEKH